ncbi:MAP3K epsilon protein kinase 1-like isoform X1 [Bidens hawaiensis]|uniref:MAP3K epsilon protein kinase 1-like isoform X1 n=1 Tax=Bidens hawaiensis TaxID=980011 RepID=UPI0040496D7D
MAPEVIEMSGVCAASDIWSVGCTVIELLTCVPPYYDLQPMPALFRIVQDEHPPIPDNLSPGLTDFLRQCFKKDARLRPDAKTLLSHPWIQNSRRVVLQSSLRHSGSLRNIDDDGSVGVKSSNADDLSTIENLSAENVKESKTELLIAEVTLAGNSYEEKNSTVEEKPDASEADVSADQVATLAIHEKPPLASSANDESAYQAEVNESSELNPTEVVLTNGESGSPKSKSKTTVDEKVKENGSSVATYCSAHNSGHKAHDYSSQKNLKAGRRTEGNELSKFSDTPVDASLEDLFQPIDKNHLDDQSAEASTSVSSHVIQGNTFATDSGKTDLATQLRATIAQKQMENEPGQSNGGDILHLMMSVLKEDVIGIDGLGFDDKRPADNLGHLQAVEFGKLVSQLRPEEPEDVIMSSCHKLIMFFQHRPEQKHVFMTQHGLLPLLELLELPRTRVQVICSLLQVLNQIIKGNTDFQENACLVGLVPVVMGFAGPDRTREVRMEAAYFLQQLCQSSSLTLQMFIACRGIPVLVGFLEADYAKYRDMVHLAIDGMWQVFKLHRSTLRNDFCRIAAKNGILLRLINTFYSLNEAARLALISGVGGFSMDGLATRSRSGPLDPNNHTFIQSESSTNGFDYADHHKVKHSVTDHPFTPGPQESSRLSSSHSPDSRFFTLETDKHQSSNTSVQPPFTSTSKSQDFDPSHDAEPKQILSNFGRLSTDRPRKSMEVASNRYSSTGQQENVRPLLSLLDKEPPSRHFSGQLEYVRHLTGLEKHETILPLLHSSNEKKPNGLDFLMAEFAEASSHGRETANTEALTRTPHKLANKKTGVVGSNENGASTSGIASHTASAVLSGSGVLYARPGSATSSGLLSHMVPPWNADVAREYLEKVADLLLEFAGADSTVKSYMCSQSLLTRLFQMFNKIEPPILLKLLKCINHLSTDPHCLEHLQRADAIKHLIPNLDLKDGPLISQIHHEVLNALFNLCKINKRRQEQAAENGIIPHLMRFIMSDSPLRQYALPLLCDMAHASRNSREQLRAHDGMDVYLNLLEDQFWSVTALDSIAVCLAHDSDNKKVEQALLKKDSIQKLVKFFQCCPEQFFLHILEPFLKIITKSSRINTTLAVNGLTPSLISRLDHQDAIARLNLLKLIKAVYEHHPRPKQLIVENNLPQKLQNLIEERRDGQSSGGQVLVKQMATSLLKALHINTVL